MDHASLVHEYGEKCKECSDEDDYPAENSTYEGNDSKSSLEKMAVKGPEKHRKFMEKNSKGGQERKKYLDLDIRKNPTRTT